MRFADCKFHGKHDVRQDTTKAILIACKESIPQFDKLNIFRVEDYIHILIDESDYNPKKHYFYDASTHIRVPLKVFKSVAIEYILEHISDFYLEKYR